MAHGKTGSLILVGILLLAGAAHADEASDKPWRATLSVGGGWSDNPGAIGNTITIGPGGNVPFLRDKGSAFGRVAFDGSYDLVADNDQLLTVGYGMHSDTYEGDAQELNFLKNTVWIGYQRKLRDDLAVSVQLADEYLHISGNEFSNAVLIEPTVYHRFAPWGSVELKYTAGFAEFLTAVPGPGFDRDGVFHDLGFTLHLDIPDTDLSAFLTYMHRWNFTDGGNGGQYDYEADIITLGLAHPLPFDIDGSFTWTRRTDDYVGIGGRNDTVDQLSVNLTRPINANARIYVRFDYTDADSNQTLYQYRQRAVATGVIFQF